MCFMPLIMLLYAFMKFVAYLYGAQVVQGIPGPHKSMCE
jgi:hypothetical protein